MTINSTPTMTLLHKAILAIAALTVLASCSTHERMVARSLSDVETLESPQQRAVVKKYRELTTTQSLQWVDPDEIAAVVDDYARYVEQTGQAMSSEMSAEVSDMLAIAEAAQWSQRVRRYYDGPYDKDANEQLLERAGALRLVALNNGQQGEVERLRRSLATYPAVISAVRADIASQLDGLADITSETMAHDLKTRLSAQARDIAGNRPEGTMCFTRYYTNLNRAFDALLSDIAVVDSQRAAAIKDKFQQQI